jgi:GNAT superfamily N-acetyltransferase
MIKTLIPKIEKLTQDDIVNLSLLINNVYDDAESGMWKVYNSRTNPEEITALIKTQNLIVAFIDHFIVGSVAVKSMNDGKTGKLGMLVADRSYRGLGIGSALVIAAENWARSKGFKRMRLELLEPRYWDHPNKIFLKGWYTRIGYQQIKTEPFEKMHPKKIFDLATECDFTVWHKTLSNF